MKNKIFITGICLSMAIISCQKNTEKLSPEDENLSELKNDEIISKIKEFKSDEIIKNEKNVSLDDAIWLLEATANYDFDYPGELQNHTIINTKFKTEKNLNNQKDLKVIYEDIKKIIQSYIFKNTGIQVIDLSTLNNNEIEITIIAGTNHNYQKILPTCQPFGSTDYWDSYSGKCGSYSGQGTTSSAWQELTKKLNAKCVTEICQNGGNIVYTNISTMQINGNDMVYDNSTLGFNILNPYDLTPQNDGITDFCLFVAWGSNQHNCLAPNEMNTYVNSIKFLANFNKPANTEIVNYNITHDFFTNGGNQHGHKLTFTSGTKTCYIETN
ncbi:MAG: hypothetical protein C0448_04795 [Sphingobacteriaceae bacterium]|nr:hypothetical protein [Sphingobacteriaceae bacterium]